MVRQGFLGVFLLCICAVLWAQQRATLNFLAAAGNCELDFEKDGRADGWWSYFDGDLRPSSVVLSLDNLVRYGGASSQRVRLQRTSGGAGRFTIFTLVNFDAHLKPEAGEPLLVRIALRAEGFQNAVYRIYIVTGTRLIELQSETSRDTGGWQLVSGIFPVELDSNGRPRFEVGVQIRVQDGAASGTLWFDEAHAVSMRTVIRTNRLPNGLKLALSYLYPEREPFRYLKEMPFGIVIGTREQAQVLLAHYPDTKWAPYCYFPATMVPTIYRHNADLYNYDDVEQNHPDWFLLDSNRRRIYVDETYYVDIGRTDVRERAWQSLRDFMNRCGRPRYIYLDNVDMRVGPERFAPPNYPTNELWVAAVVGWFEYVGTRLRNEFGATFIPNAAWAPGFWLRGIGGASDAPGVATLPYIGGFLIEHAFTMAWPDGRTTINIYGAATGYSHPSNWGAFILRNTVRLATEYPDKIVVLIPTFWTNKPDSQQKIRFAIAGCLIVQHENTFVQLDPRYEQEQYAAGYYPAELFVPLGLPVGTYRIVDGDLLNGGLFVRDYENGVVLWNPRHDRTYTYTVPRDYYDWDRNRVSAGTRVQIAPQTGLVLYAAPEIALTISPTTVNVLPGQTVQFTVTYQNRGTAAGTNVRIAVPLPDGMRLVSSTPTATVENGQLVWIVPSVPVGGSGTLQFTVRVE